MKLTEKIKKFLSTSREKHKLTFIDDSTYHEKWGFKLSMMNLYSLLALYTIVIIVVLFALIRYTPLQQLFSTGVSSTSWKQVEDNSQSLDSLYFNIEANQKKLDNLMAILNNESMYDSLYQPLDSVLDNFTPDFSSSIEDSIFRDNIENNNHGNYNMVDHNLSLFFVPVHGTISKSFNLASNHTGVDIVTKKDEAIKVCLDGTIIFSGWSTSDGNIIVVQHTNDLISVYKHCSVLLKNQGNKVQEGDPIAIVGDTGKNSSGPHLHFELWKGGNPLNPQEFISF